MGRKNKTGIKARILAISILLVLLTAMLGCSAVYAQQITDAVTSNMAQNLPHIFNPATWGTETTGALPLWFTFQNNMECEPQGQCSRRFRAPVVHIPE